jgi:GAF domain-containing protein
VGADAAFFDNPDLPDTRSEMALPLRVGESVIGVLDVQSTEAEAFTDEDAAVLQSLADQIAVAIENARLYQQMEEAAEAERRARGEASRRTWETYLQQQQNLGFVKDNRTLRLLEDAASGASSGRVVSVPVRVGDQEVAAIEIPFSEAQATWTAEQVSMLEALADQVGRALDRAQLYESTERTATRERVISESAARIRASLDMEVVLQTAVREVAESLGIDQAEIRLGTGPTRRQA